VLTPRCQNWRRSGRIAPACFGPNEWGGQSRASVRVAVYRKHLISQGNQRPAKPFTPVRSRPPPPVLKKRRGAFFLRYRFKIALCPSGEIGRHSGLKIRRLPEKGRTGSIPVSGTKSLCLADSSGRWVAISVLAFSSLAESVLCFPLNGSTRPVKSLCAETDRQDRL
jgi:hypothetical protein